MSENPTAHDARFLPIALFVTPTEDESGDHDLYVHLLDRDYKVARLYNPVPLTGAGCLLAELLCGRVNVEVARAFDEKPALWKLVEAIEALLPTVDDPSSDDSETTDTDHANAPPTETVTA